MFDEALELYEQLLVVSNKDTSEKNTNRTTALIYTKIGLCKVNLQKCSKSADCFQNAIKVFQLTCLDQETDKELAFAFNELGSALVEIHQHDDALIYLQRSMEI